MDSPLDSEPFFLRFAALPVHDFGGCYCGRGENGPRGEEGEEGGLCTICFDVLLLLPTDATLFATRSSQKGEMVAGFSRCRDSASLGISFKRAAD